MIYLLRIEAPHPIAMRKPSETSAAVSGPAVGGSSFLQPLPSRLAGTLAGIAYYRGRCCPESCGEDGFDNVYECLRVLLGEKFHIYAGLAVDRDGRVYYFYFDEAGGRGECFITIADSGKGIEYRVPRRFNRIGIALNRLTKTTRMIQGRYRAGLLYVDEQVDIMGVELSYAALIECSLRDPLKPGARLPAPMGADARTVFLELQSLEKRLEDVLVIGNPSGNKWYLVLATPALLNTSPWRSDPIKLIDGKARRLGELLLEASGVQLDIVSVHVPKTIPGLEVVAPGWCMPEGRPRRPYLYVPAGTTIFVEAGRETVERIVRSGVGLHTSLGWGTVYAVDEDTMGRIRGLV